ncbi:unnamed protein product [Prunus armeniaca]
MMNIIAWNVRGAGKDRCASTIKDLKKAYVIDVFAVLEPRISGPRVLSVAQSLGFSHYHIVDASGFSGGVWLLWNGNSVSLQVVAHSSQSITALVNLRNHRWLLTVVYANPCPGICEALWKYFDGLIKASNLPWLVLGDFNDIVSMDEKCGGNFDQGGKRFGEWIDRNHLVYLGFSGAKFTWCNKRNAEGIIWKRLDRGLCSIDWRLLFPEAHLMHLPRVNSDHCPILVRLDSKHYPNRANVPFRFQAMWMSHPDFKDFVTNLWSSGDGHAVHRTASLVAPLGTWNQQVFGCLFTKKRHLLARLARIQKKLCHEHNPFLSKLEVELTKDYNLLLDQEEIFWLQKSRNTWLNEGDRNTRFFHLSTIVRRRRNKLEGLHNDFGDWITEKQSMKHIIVKYFQGLFSASDMVGDYALLPQLFPSLEGDELEGLSCPVSIEEIKNSVFAIGRFKTPGPDGFPALFYQDYWGVCSDDIISFVQDCFNTASLPDHLNETLISLVPKVERPMCMNQLRPISLCNTLYKVVSKILVARLRPCMTKLVSPSQVSFVPGRQITDNIIVAQEVLHKFKSAKGKKGFIAWKIDLSKACDLMQWPFIREVLWEAGIKGSILELLMQCITSVQYKAILNGELTDSFSPQCGIRQGDPLSPYIFVLCMEKLSHLIRKRFKIELGNLFRFVKELSGQRVSFEKSMIFVSPNTNSELANAIAAISGSPLTASLGKYLGVPLIHTRVNKQTYQEVIAKVQMRLASWKSHTLSMAGRITLLESVTAAIPIYTMQTAKLPMSVCDKLDQLNRNFLWGHTSNTSKIHLVNWEQVCKPKVAGGLGIKRSSWMNQALLAKTGWRLLQHEQGLWSQVFHAKYLKQQNILAVKDSYFPCSSSVWRGVLYGNSALSKGIKWRVGSGDNVLFWTDRWLSCGPLYQYAIIDLSEEMLKLNVGDFLEEGVWDVNCLRECLPLHIIHLILSVHAGFNGSGTDRYIWQFTPNGSFSVNSAYSSLFPAEASVKWDWQFLWRLRLPPKVKTFLRIVCHQKLLTNVQRQKRGLTQVPTCPRCDYPMETIAHLFKDCPFSLAIWNCLQIGDNSSPDLMEFKEWLLRNLQSKRMVYNGLPWPLVFALYLWFIWKWRCKGIFDQRFVMPVDPQQLILQYAWEWFNANKPPSHSYMPSVVQLHWIAPTHGVCKINTDGSRNSDSGSIGAGGLLRDNYGAWIKGFSVNLGVGSVLEAELWGHFLGASFGLGVWLSFCGVKHIFREQNVAADVLASKSSVFGSGVLYFTEVPDFLVTCLAEDAIGVSRSRVVGA